MKFADWFRGGAQVALADVAGVFDAANGFVEAAPLPGNIKADLKVLLTDAKADLMSVVGLAGTTAGNLVADGIDDLTTLMLNTAQVVSSGKPLEELSAAEKAVLTQTWTAMKAQGDTLVAQFMAGLDPTKKPAPPVP